MQTITLRTLLASRPEPVTPEWRALITAWFAEAPEVVPAVEHIRVGAGWPEQPRA